MTSTNNKDTANFLKPNNPFEKAQEKPKTIPLPTTKKGNRSTYKKPSTTVSPAAQEAPKIGETKASNPAHVSHVAHTTPVTPATPISGQTTTNTSNITGTTTRSSLTSSAFKTSYNETLEKKDSLAEMRSRILEKEKSTLLSKVPPTNSPLSKDLPKGSTSTSTNSRLSSTNPTNSFNATSNAHSANPTLTKLNLVNSHSLISSANNTQTKSSSFLDRNKESSTSFSSKASTPSTLTSRTSVSSETSKSAKSPLNSEISDAEFIKLRDFLYEQSGIYVTETRKYLFKNRLLGRLNELELNSYDEYYTYLKTKDTSKKELNKFYEQMTTNETSFFRNVPQLNTVNEHVFKKYIELNKKDKKLNIFSAGCSSGEEPYTLAIMLLELLKAEKNQWKIKITAGDLSPAMLVAAHEGLYTEYSLRSTPKEYIKKYFTQKGDLFEVNQEVKKLVSFTQINLNDRAMVKKLVPQSDIVFCRNVIIYFDDEVKKNVVGAFYENLIMGGSLVIGHSETLNNITSQFEVSYLPNTQVYTKI